MDTESPQLDKPDQPKRVRIDIELLDQLRRISPDHWVRQGDAFLIEEYTRRGINVTLDTCGTLGELSAPQAGPRPYGADSSTSTKESKQELNRAQESSKTESKKEADPFRLKALKAALIPETLKDQTAEIVEFWKVKKGTRSEGAARRLFSCLEGMTPADRVEALHRATDSGWATVFVPKGNTPAQAHAETVHPSQMSWEENQRRDLEAQERLKALIRD